MRMRIDPWKLVFLSGFIVYVVIRGVFKQRVKGNEMIVRRVDGLEKALMVIVIPGGLLLPVVYLFTPWLGFADYHLPPLAPWCGAMLMIAAQDDPFVPYELFLRADPGQNRAIEYVTPEHGGHCGFISNRIGAERFWAEQMIVKFCDAIRAG